MVDATLCDPDSRSFFSVRLFYDNIYDLHQISFSLGIEFHLSSSDVEKPPDLVIERVIIID